MFLIIEFNFNTGILPEKYLVSGFDVQGDYLPFLITSWARCHDLAFLRLLLGGVRDDDTRLGLSLQYV